MFWKVTLDLLEGFSTTLQIFGLTLLFALPLGLLICFGSMSKLGIKITNNFGIYPISWIFKLLVWIIRGTPLMLQIIVVFYGPGLLFNMPLMPRFTAVIITFVINYACYFSEIYRGGIESIPKGQYEAGQVLGMTKSQIFFKVVLFQVIKRIIPPIGNEIITLVKDTSLARIIAVYEIIWSAQNYIKLEGLIWPLLYTAVFYLLFNGIVTLLLGFAEKKMNYYRG